MNDFPQEYPVNFPKSLAVEWPSVTGGELLVASNGGLSYGARLPHLLERLSQGMASDLNTASVKAAFLSRQRLSSSKL
jgi:hypothetical protein